GTRQCEWPRQRFFIASIRHEVTWIGRECNRYLRKFLKRRQSPRFGAIREVAVRKIEDGHHVLEGEAHGFNRHVEAIGRRCRSDDDRGAFAVSSPDSLKEISLLSLCRQAGRRAAALNVDYNER